MTFKSEWCAHFRSGRQSVGSDDGAGKPHSAVTAVNTASVFWDSQGIIVVNFEPLGYIVNAVYTTLRPVTWPPVRRKRPNLLRKGVVLHHGNAASHKASQIVEKVALMGRKLLPHPPYISDLAPSDFQPFGLLKQSLGGLKFQDEQQHVLKFFHITDKDFYATGFRQLVERWERCVNLQRDYIEK